MKQKQVLFFAAIATSTFCMETTCTENTESKCLTCLEKQQNEANQRDKVMIANLLNALANFLHIFAPKDKEKEAILNSGITFTQSVASILTNEARKCVELGIFSPEEILDYVSAECTNAQVDATITESLTRAIKAEYCKSAILSEETRARYAEQTE
jgi:hypothetical protein